MARVLTYSTQTAEAAQHDARGKVIKPRGLLDLRGELGPTRTIVAGGLAREVKGVSWNCQKIHALWAVTSVFYVIVDPSGPP